jgi:hypothetical protein
MMELKRVLTMDKMIDLKKAVMIQLTRVVMMD